MAFEKRLPKVDPQSFTTDGTAGGRLNVNDACLFKVKQHVLITGDGLPNLELEVKCVTSSTEIIVGPRGGSIKACTDISAYTTALNSAISANEQQHPAVPIQEIERFVYEEEPTVAYRTIMVDKLGDVIDDGNPLPVEATINVSNVGTPTIFNVAAANKGVEYSQLLPDNTAQFILKARNGAKLQLSYVSGQTGTNYLTLTPGNIYTVESVKLTGKTIYFQSSKDDTVVEIVTWT